MILFDTYRYYWTNVPFSAPRILKNDTVMLVARFNTDVRCTEHNTNVEIGNGTS